MPKNVRIKDAKVVKSGNTCLVALKGKGFESSNIVKIDVFQATGDPRTGYSVKPDIWVVGSTRLWTKVTLPGNYNAELGATDEIDVTVLNPPSEGAPAEPVSNTKSAEFEEE